MRTGDENLIKRKKKIEMTYLVPQYLIDSGKTLGLYAMP